MAETKDIILSRLLVAIVVITIAVATPGCLMGGDDGDSAKSADGPSADLGHNSGPNNPIGAVETKTPDVELITTEPAATETKLLKKVGPFKLSLNSEIEESPTLATDYKEEKVEIKDCSVRIVTNSITEPTVRIDRKSSWTRSSGNFFVLVVLKDKNGEPEKSLCKLDKETGNYYYSKTSMVSITGMVETEYAVSQRGRTASGWKNVTSWEVLVYG